MGIEQLIVQVSTSVIFLLSAMLSLLLTRKFIVKRHKSYLFWSIGMWLFAFGSLLEILFASGIYGRALIDVYLFIVALLVESLALGSMQLIKSEKIRLSYYVFCVATSLLLAYSIFTTQIGNIITTYVVFGGLPLAIIITSSLVTFPASAVLVIIAALSYKKSKNKKMLYIIAGVVIVSIGSTLYITGIPEFLYFVEFIGIILLWLAFF